MNGLILSMFVSTILSGVIATVRDRSVILWTVLGMLTGPIAVAFLLCVPSRKAVITSTPTRSLASEIRELQELRERGLISDEQFEQGKARVLAWPVGSASQPALGSTRALADSGWTWASYHPAARAAFIDLAQRYRLELEWPDDVPFEAVCTFPVQPRLSFAITLALEKGSIHCWGDGWALDGSGPGNPDIGLPADLAEGLEALISGSGRLLVRTAFRDTSPFWTSLQVQRNGRWRTVRYQAGLPILPLWRRIIVKNEAV
ncbi:SHOCT domain-containing protein [Sphingomonas montana]|uniref:SHOCT domain-containing protein n=1 Tax=Sphingomonas montana TaxID=1843236 RepID=UPI00101AE387|nr:SHOCT domain-containing protein [Sphingomonas montana]